MAGAGLMPRGGIYHPDWASSSRTPITTAQTAVANITREGAGGGVLDRATGMKTGPARATVAYQVSCRVTVTPRLPSVTAVAEQAVTIRRYNVEVPWDVTGVRVNDRVEITTAGDPDLTGRSLQVLSVVAESQTWTRVLGCQLDEG